MPPLSHARMIWHTSGGEALLLRLKRAGQPERTNVALTFIGKVGVSSSDAFRSAVNDARDAQSADLA